ncbi:hypothetical protein BDU57DRAFT_516231 [Ampelomyces quisqualis]|uniref:Uncharacterized protein n=1 Tax=Ampelomyces quisqualis TaxID=50730 RepID=A0A6A5QN58_AMPQU|nr:hypothetical protein BDU57DRAFT_516231 [Ampelomyces quisqualis]
MDGGEHCYAHLCTIAATPSCRNGLLFGGRPVPAGTACSGYRIAPSASHSQVASVPRRSGLPVRARIAGRQWPGRRRVLSCTEYSRARCGGALRYDEGARSLEACCAGPAAGRHARREGYGAGALGVGVGRRGIRDGRLGVTWLRARGSGAGRWRLQWLRKRVRAMTKRSDGLVVEAGRVV